MSAKDLTDCVAIVTGSGRGIGEAVAKKFASHGAHVVINDIDEKEASRVAADVEKLGVQSLVSTHDISDYDAAYALVGETFSKFKRIDVLINNAGITRDGMLHKLEEKLFDEVVRVNLKGTFNMGQACARMMMEQKSGKIVNLASIAMRGNIGQSNYSASKAGVAGMTRTWAKELSKHNINVNCIAPGMIDTQLTQAIPDEIRENFIKRIPLKRIGTPDDIANLAYFLSSEQGSYITGQTITIDGGLTVGW